MHLLVISHTYVIRRSTRRGAGAVERGGLENRCAFTGTQGSNPCLSAIGFTAVESGQKLYAAENAQTPSGVNPVRSRDHFQPVRVHAGGQRNSIDPRVFRVQSLRHFALACRIERNPIRVQAGRVAPNIKLRKHRRSDNGKSSFRMRSVRKHGTSLCRGKAYAIRWTLKNGDF